MNADYTQNHEVTQRDEQFPAAKPLWSPRAILVVSIVFTFLVGGIMAGINYGRLGESRKKFRIILGSVIAYVLILFSLALSSFLTGDPVARIALSTINIAIAWYIRKGQQVYFQRHIAAGGERAGLVKPILCGCATLLLPVAIVFVIEVMLSDGRKATGESNLFPGFEIDKVSSVEIKTRDRKVKLQKKGGIWVVTTADNYPADSKAVGDMLSKAEGLKTTHIASRSAEKHSLFEVDETGVGVAMLGADGNVLAHFFVGKMGPDYISTYVRKADQDEVLLVGEYLRGVFDRGARGWRDRAIFDFDASQVQTLTLVSEEKGEIAIAAQEGGGWQIIKPEVAPAEKEAVDDIVSEISKLEADDFAEEKEASTEEATDPLKEYKLDKPQSKVMVDLTDGTGRVLLIGDESGYRRYVKREDKDTIFLVSKSKIDRIFKGLEELKAEPEDEQEAYSSDEASEAEKTP